ncbi:hypothetical protein U91I_03674 [alpha proteobacterium U9-1i]|nr:hypothetical protein U91I_03674 [alpha proteobacterium U9-1i]
MGTAFAPHAAAPKALLKSLARTVVVGAGQAGKQRMKSVKKIIGLAMLAGAAMGATSVAHAEGTVSGNVALTTDYVWRGVSQSAGDAAVSGGFDYTNGVFYTGVWASSISAGEELDLYAGITPVTGPVTWNFGVVGYFYPGSDDSGGDLDFWEVRGGGSITPVENLSVGLNLWYSDDFGTTDSESLYTELSGSYAFTEVFSVSGAYGAQTIDVGGDYDTFNVGGTVALHGFKFDLRYHDTDITGADEIINFTISRAL